MTSITMSANSSDVDVDVVAGPGPGGCVGSALAVPIANAESPITAPATDDNSHRIATPFSIAAQLDSAKLAPDRIRCMLNTTNLTSSPQ
jgi:hypothetical protein